MYTIATAAAAIGRNKSVILRAIKAGKISVAKDENAEWQIDPTELHRIYPPLRSACRAAICNCTCISRRCLRQFENHGLRFHVAAFQNKHWVCSAGAGSGQLKQVA
jgi:hypothetical protein